VQRLFSTFAGGRPGVGLLLQRLLTGAVLLHHGILCLSDTIACAVIVPQMVAAGAGVLLLVGLWTPVAGTLVAIMEGWIVLSSAGDDVSSAMLAVLGATLALIGPGAWSIDCRLFGRRHIEAMEL
jgi:hypothetical protein